MDIQEPKLSNEMVSDKEEPDSRHKRFSFQIADAPSVYLSFREGSYYQLVRPVV